MDDYLFEATEAEATEAEATETEATRRGEGAQQVSKIRMTGAIC
jgi:hypothetical protein